jgi:hypothetical protein
MIFAKQPAVGRGDKINEYFHRKRVPEEIKGRIVSVDTRGEQVIQGFQSHFRILII